MVFQSDVIPSSPTYWSTRMEDGFVLADEALQERLRTAFPAMHARCLERRRFMRETLGLEVQEDVLPLSNIAGRVSPYLLRSSRVMVYR
jgi:hypothetical protein